MKTDTREALYGGAVGGGKSAGLLASALRYVDRPGYRALLLRRTYAELSKGDGLIPLSHEWLGQRRQDGLDPSWNEQRKTWKFPSGATIEFGHVQHEEDKRNYQGAAYQFVGFDELTHFTDSVYFYIGFSRQRRRTALADIPVQTYSSANPGGIGHLWVRRRFIDERAPETMFIPATIADNPGLDAEDYEASLVQLGLHSEALRKQLMEGDWGAFEGAAYDYRDAEHTVEVFSMPAEWERFEFMDHGTTNPAAWYLVVIDYDGNLIVTDEYYQGRTLIHEHCAEVLKRRPYWYPAWTGPDSQPRQHVPRTIADPSVTTSLGTLSSKQGIPATIATEYMDQSDGKIVLIPGNHDRQAGKTRIQELLRCDPERLFPEWHRKRGSFGAPRLYVVASRCPNLVEQLKAAPVLALDSGKREAGEIVDPDWEGQYGHSVAALRYGVLSRPDASSMTPDVPTDPRTIALLEHERRVRAGAGQHDRYVTA